MQYMSATLIAKAKEVRDDNEPGKGDHYHHGDREEAYTFTAIEQLLVDFEQDLNEWRNP